MDLKDKPQITKNTNFWQSLGHAKDGLIDLVTEERNFRSHLVSAFLVILAGLLFRVSLIDWAWLFLVIFLVIIAETINTIIENVVDLVVGKRYNVIAKRIKDIAAGGVLITSGFAVLVGCIIFVPLILKWF